MKVEITEEQILNILKSEPKTRDELCELLGLKKNADGVYICRTTVYDHLNSLIQRKIVTSSRIKIKNRGRPNVVFSIIQKI